jgi:hypothetical protein
MLITVVRTNYTPESTTGIMLIDGSYFGVTLEDLARIPSAPKVYGQTCIPAGYYTVKNTMSPHFGKRLPEILAVPGYEGIRFHGGNKAADTLGCVLVARERTSLDWIRGSLSDELVKRIDAVGGYAHTEIMNGFPYYYKVAA